ncbi:MAG: hypothetical protein AAGA23_12830, partial [Pseudomonadota bacterium]
AGWRPAVVSSRCVVYTSNLMAGQNPNDSTPSFWTHIFDPEQPTLDEQISFPRRVSVFRHSNSLFQVF